MTLKRKLHVASHAHRTKVAFCRDCFARSRYEMKGTEDKYYVSTYISILKCMKAE